jgi:hypothetical protein
MATMTIHLETRQTEFDPTDPYAMFAKRPSPNSKKYRRCQLLLNDLRHDYKLEESVSP